MKEVYTMKKLLENIRQRISVWRRKRELKQELKNLWLGLKIRQRRIWNWAIEADKNKDDEEHYNRCLNNIKETEIVIRTIQESILETRKRLAELNKN